MGTRYICFVVIDGYECEVEHIGRRIFCITVKNAPIWFEPDHYKVQREIDKRNPIK